MIVGPSKRRRDWASFFASRHWQPEAFARLVEADEIGSAFFEVETQINGLYRARQLAHARQRQAGPPVDGEHLGEGAVKARWLTASFEPFRAALGPRQRDLDLGLMRWIRRASCLSVVIGAGATMDAGGPSWAELVRRLLAHLTEHGRDICEMRLTPESTPDNLEYRRVVTGRERLPADAASRARAVLALIDAGTADIETLMEGAQICHEFLGQALFTDLTGILYEGQRRPGAIHRAIAELAAPIEVTDRGGLFPGWDAIITYNFDDLMGEALDEAGVARAAYAMRGDQVAGDPNQLARERGPHGLHQPIYHLHGYTPRRLFLIAKVQFVFATSQYTRTYGGSPAGIVGEVFARCLANPVRHALYVGCSFDDEAMNELLRQAARALPGRYHYALLRWPGDGRFAAATADEVALAAARYVSMGVRPIWFDDFGEIPGLIRCLA
ncbi:MAG: hypothetical protein FAZ92_01663 [Accumulibacter sp.]|uniref:SIR2 family NAD-dependent protein deacylase n=1 Tax=Accumulibacter sp. TaxID=2053492 RepID=UPI00120CB16E|nr:SIR2 family protein [Accumulibacter sp.]TLD46055.1 MAG: hypothetical protein FAZ92_01663 [Accumulibacter sp.]